MCIIISCESYISVLFEDVMASGDFHFVVSKSATSSKGARQMNGTIIFHGFICTRLNGIR